jgi:putative transposase
MVNTREIAEEYRLSHWAQVMQERAQSGLSIKAYCKQIGICGNTYFYWQRRVRAAACEALTVPHEASVPGKTLIPSGWAVCEVEEPTPEKKALAIEIGGYRISVESGVDQELLAKTCQTLKSIC